MSSSFPISPHFNLDEALDTNEQLVEGENQEAQEAPMEEDVAARALDTQARAQADIPVCGECELDDQEADAPRMARAPGQPSQADIDQHELTHCPYRSWCDACVRGQAKDSPSTKVSGQFAENNVARVRMDYMFLTEDVEVEAGEEGEKKTEAARASMTVVVMQE